MQTDIYKAIRDIQDHDAMVFPRLLEKERQTIARQRITDPMTMWHAAEKSGPIKLHDAETGLTTIPEQKPEPEGLTVWQMVGAFLAMGVTALVAIGMALVL